MKLQPSLYNQINDNTLYTGATYTQVATTDNDVVVYNSTGGGLSGKSAYVAMHGFGSITTGYNQYGTVFTIVKPQLPLSNLFNTANRGFTLTCFFRLVDPDSVANFSSSWGRQGVISFQLASTATNGNPMNWGGFTFYEISVGRDVVLSRFTCYLSSGGSTTSTGQVPLAWGVWNSIVWTVNVISDNATASTFYVNNNPQIVNCASVAAANYSPSSQTTGTFWSSNPIGTVSVVDMSVGLKTNGIGCLAGDVVHAAMLDYPVTAAQATTIYNYHQSL